MSTHPSAPDFARSALDQTPVQSPDERDVSRQLSIDQSPPPGHVPGYEIERQLGEGSFGSVWLARELKTGKQVAIKFYTHRRGLNWSLLSREVEKLAVLYTSRNIVGLLDVGWDHEPPYFVMEYLERGSLANRLASGPLPVEEAVRIGEALARALVHAHSSGILHCDIKPANILLDAHQEPRLGDFGQSRLTTEQSPALGTFFYMAPEQAVLQGAPDVCWDVYALGAVLYEMLTGAPPYETPYHSQQLSQATTLDDRLQAYRRIVMRSQRPVGHEQLPGVDGPLAQIIDQCLERDPVKRTPSAQAVLDALERRRQSRAKRPLIALGFLGPIVLLLAMYWIAETAVPRIVDAAERNLVDRALDSDVVTAEILAESVQQELSARQAVLESLAESPRLRQLIDDARRLTDAELFDRCDRAARESGTDSPADDPYDWMNGVVRAAQQHLESEGRTVDESWFITDVDGRQIFRLPPKDSGHKTTLGRSFHWRDYYHGLGRELPPDTPRDSVSIRTQPGISFPFRSRATEQFMIAIAAPVRGEDGQQVIGVVARTIGLPQLLRQWEVEMHLNGGTVPPRTELHNRFLALADTRGGYASLLDHPWMTHARLENMSDSEIDSPDSPLRIERDMAVTLTSQRKTDRYRDPIGAIDQDFQGDWLAAAAPVGRTGWLAIVQERRDATVRPVDDLRRVFVNAGVWSVAIFSILLGLLWYLLRRAAT